jgi:type VI secretion system protein ImpC
MADKVQISTSSVGLGIELSRLQPAVRDASIYRILVIGNLGAATPFHRPISIDCDDLDKVIQQLQVCTRVQLKEGDPVVGIPFRDFEDFHPDRLFRRLSLFESLRLRRKRLQDESTCQEEIAAILNLTSRGSESAATFATQSEGPQPNAETLLSDVVNITEAAQKPLEQQILAGNFDWDNYVRHLVAPFVVSKADPRQSELIEGVDSAVAETMRSILHNEAFQNLEATWQGIRFLTRRLETSRTLQLSVMHVAPDELQADLLCSDDLKQSRLFKLLVDDVTGEGINPWSLVVGDFQFGISPEQCEVLARIARICEAAGTIFASGAAPEIAGCENFATCKDPVEAIDPRHWKTLNDEQLQRWNQIRNLPSSRYVVLALPKLMARRPYGPESDQIESFAFDELLDGTRREQYLWMNAAFGIAAVFGSAFAAVGRDFAQEIPGELESLPIHVFSDGAEEQIQHGTILPLSDRAAEKFAESGLTIFRAVRHEDTIRVAIVRSLSTSYPELPGF